MNNDTTIRNSFRFAGASSTIDPTQCPASSISLAKASQADDSLIVNDLCLAEESFKMVIDS
jgi:hypothetical protein